MRVYGPYRGNSGREHVIEIDADGTRRTVSYPKWLLEKHLGRSLLDDETVDHIDGDFNNNEIANLQILDRKVHATLDAKRVRRKEISCDCGVVFTPSRHQASARHKDNAGPFCSRRCSGLYGKSIQQGIKKMKRKQIVSEVYTLKQEPAFRKDSSGDDDIGETFNNGNPEGTRKGHRRD